MTRSLFDRLLTAIDSGNLFSEVIPIESAANPSAHDLFAIVLMINEDVIARVGVWKNPPDKVTGNGAPRVHAEGSTVNVTAGERMSGSFSIECDFAGEAEEIAQVLRDTLESEYECIPSRIGAEA